MDASHKQLLSSGKQVWSNNNLGLSGNLLTVDVNLELSFYAKQT